MSKCCGITVAMSQNVSHCSDMARLSQTCSEHRDDFVAMMSEEMMCLARMETNEAATSLGQMMECSKASAIVTQLEANQAATILLAMDTTGAATILRQISSCKAGTILAEMMRDNVATTIVSKMGINEVARILTCPKARMYRVCRFRASLPEALFAIRP